MQNHRMPTTMLYLRVNIFSQSSWCTYLDTTCRTVKRTMRGPTATRNQGKTPEITPTQKNTRMTFWMNISA